MHETTYFGVALGTVELVDIISTNVSVPKSKTERMLGTIQQIVTGGSLRTLNYSNNPSRAPGVNRSGIGRQLNHEPKGAAQIHERAAFTRRDAARRLAADSS